MSWQLCFTPAASDLPPAPLGLARALDVTEAMRPMQHGSATCTAVGVVPRTVFTLDDPLTMDSALE
eukprot:7334551-Pyramimonas_sp.AAC.1